ncbi:MAG TPA: hypothetical protein P5528_16700 [Steroidobacteraceae bacterium]|nr:hypothetical protein [Steroidobacteraceae bacterium]
MFSAMFLVNAVLQAVLFVWLVRIWRRTRAAAAAVLLIPQFFLIWDNSIVGSGQWIGFGELLESLNWARFWAHWLFGSWLIVASGSILRLAGFRRAQQRWIMALFCLLTVGVVGYEVHGNWHATLMPVCEYDLLRYNTSVRAEHLCSPEQAVVPGGGAPLGPLVTVFVVIGVGAALALRRRFPWMLVGGILMFISATPLLMRYKLDNFGEVMIAFGAIWAVAHFTSRDRTIRFRVGS